MTSQVTEQQVRAALATVVDPDLHKDIVTLNMVRSVTIDGGSVTVLVTLTTPACPLKDVIERDIRAVVEKLPGVTGLTVTWDANVSRSRGMTGRQEVAGVRNVIAVSAAKGGVGKTTVSVNLALALASAGARVGLLDADVYGPNVPIMLGLEGEPEMAPSGRMEPMVSNGIKVVSFGSLVREGQPIIWRGPMLAKALREFLYEVEWGELDYLLVDLPPGTGDVQLTLAQSVPMSGVVIVTTPQDVAVADVSRGIAMFQQLSVPVLGVVENMAGFVCGHCGEVTEIFGGGGAAQLAQMYNLPLLGSIPLNVAVRTGGRNGGPLMASAADSAVAALFVDLAGAVASAASRANFDAAVMPQMPPARTAPA